MDKKLAHLSIEQKIKWLEDYNAAHSTMYCSPDQELSRRLYLSKHPTRIAAFKCMDGRINLPIVTKKPPGIITSFRNLAGKFDLGWPYLGEVFQEWLEDVVKSGHQSLVLVTYHYSASDDATRGCAGFNYDRNQALDYIKKFKAQIERVFGKNHQVLYPIIVGLETDADILVFHGENGSQLDLSSVKTKNSQELQAELIRLDPDMPAQILSDVLPLVLGNIEHINEIAETKRPIIEAEHREWILGLGRGFDWLHEPNIALLVGPYSPNLEKPIKTALSIILSNMEKQRIADDGFVLLTSASYSRYGVDRARAEEKALFLSGFAREVAKEHYPDLAKIMRELTVVLHQETRRFEVVVGASMAT